MRKEWIVMTFYTWQWNHPAIAHKFLDCKFTGEAKEISRDRLASRLVTCAGLSVEDLSRPEMAARCFPHVLRIRH
jgi:hypothetical protein